MKYDYENQRIRLLDGRIIKIRTMSEAHLKSIVKDSTEYDSEYLSLINAELDRRSLQNYYEIY